MGAVIPPMTDAFRRQMARLLGLRFAPADLTTHWEGLHDVEEAVLEAAVSRAQRTRTDFPTPAELREDCDAVAHTVRSPIVEEDRGVDLVRPVTLGTLPTGKEVTADRLWRYYCETCGDTGTELLWCGEAGPTRKPWQVLQHCERTKAHDPHEWTRRCTCWESNPALIKRRDRERQYAEKKGSKKVA